MDPRPIGVFDSGVGGLTVFHALERAVPAESMVYLGDTARVPYGTRSAETVARYSLEARASSSASGSRWSSSPATPRRPWRSTRCAPRRRSPSSA